ncbi:MAG: hypothetical protein SGI89_01210 [bacterium]|nr:hypothetical protein [bacterium]
MGQEEKNLSGSPQSTEPGLLTGMFNDRGTTERSYNTLRERGYSDEDINMIMTDETRTKYFKDGETEVGTKAMEDSGKGAAIGGTVGAVAGVIAALGTSLLIPGLGLVIAGPIIAGLAGAGAGGIAGGLIGALIGAGVPEERAKLYESGVKDGKIIMGVRPKNKEDAEYFQNDWRNNKGEEIHY